MIAECRGVGQLLAISVSAKVQSMISQDVSSWALRSASDECTSTDEGPLWGGKETAAFVYRFQIILSAIQTSRGPKNHAATTG